MATLTDVVAVTSTYAKVASGAASLSMRPQGQGVILLVIGPDVAPVSDADAVTLGPDWNNLTLSGSFAWCRVQEAGKTGSLEVISA